MAVNQGDKQVIHTGRRPLSAMIIPMSWPLSRIRVSMYLSFFLIGLLLLVITVFLYYRIPGSFANVSRLSALPLSVASGTALSPSPRPLPDPAPAFSSELHVSEAFTTPPFPPDLSCGDVLSLTKQTLISTGVSAPSLSVHAVRNIAPDMQVVRLMLILPTNLGLEAVFSALQRVFHPRGQSVTLETVSPRRALITITHHHHPCVEVLCQHAYELAPAQPPSDGLEAPESTETPERLIKPMEVPEGPVPVEPADREEMPQETEERAPESQPHPAVIKAEEEEPGESLQDEGVHQETSMPPASLQFEAVPRDILLPHLPTEAPLPPEEPLPVSRPDQVATVKETPLIPAAPETEGEVLSEESVSEPEGEVKKPKGKIAIILDDGGYGGSETEIILGLSNRLTLAILPDTPFAQYTAERAAKLGFEIMLHMPMQTNHKGNMRFPGELTFAMTKEETQRRTLECIAQFPNAVGVNNHTGAAYTRNEERMRWFLEIVRDMGLYFVDSRTTAKSKGYAVAVELGIPAANRDVFLDHCNGRKEIHRQFQELVRLAKTRGWAIGIGHFRKNTVSVLKWELSRLDELGVELVPVSALVQ